MANVTNDGFVFHQFKMLTGNQVTATRCGHNDIGFLNGIYHFFTSKPSIAACKAQMGSISVTITRQPAPAKEAAEPFPTSPYPPTTATLPANITSVARRIASTKLSLQPYLLSN